MQWIADRLVCPRKENSSHSQLLKAFAQLLTPTYAGRHGPLRLSRALYAEEERVRSGSPSGINLPEDRNCRTTLLPAQALAKRIDELHSISLEVRHSRGRSGVGSSRLVVGYKSLAIPSLRVVTERDGEMLSSRIHAGFECLRRTRLFWPELPFLFPYPG